MFLPNGSLRNNIDPIMFLNVWAHHLNKQKHKSKKMIFAGMGKPSYLLDETIVATLANYWTNVLKRTEDLKKNIAKNNFSVADRANFIVENSTSIDYDLPTGNTLAKKIMAMAMSNWYGVKIEQNQIIFCVGGASALGMIFRILNKQNPNSKIVTTSPFYPLYNNPGYANDLSLIDLMNVPDYKLSAKLLEEHISKLKNEKSNIGAFLFCDPHNPLGQVVGKEEWVKIAQVLSKTDKNIPIILDEAYAELVFSSEKHVSLLSVAPQLRERILVLRSATKSLSASGERMAIIICSNEQWQDDLATETIISYGHAPISLQFAYANALYNFDNEKVKGITDHYECQIKLAQERLNNNNFQIPNLKVKSTFYIIANLNCILNSKLPESTYAALGKKELITTDEDIAFTFLFEDQVMVTPLSYFGADPKLGYIRITCSGGIQGVNEIIDRMEARIAIVNKSKLLN